MESLRTTTGTSWHVPPTRWASVHTRLLLPRALPVLLPWSLLLVGAIGMLIVYGDRMPGSLRLLFAGAAAYSAWAVWYAVVAAPRRASRSMEFDGPLTLELTPNGVVVRGPTTRRRYAGPNVRVVRFDGWTLLQGDAHFNPDIVPPRAASHAELRDAVRRASIAPALDDPVLEFRAKALDPAAAWLGNVASLSTLRWTAFVLAVTAVAVHVQDQHDLLLSAPVFFAAYLSLQRALAWPTARLTRRAHPFTDARFGFDDAGITVARAGYVERLSWATCTLMTVDRDDTILMIAGGLCVELEADRHDAEPLRARAFAARHAPASLLPGDGSDPLGMRMFPRGTIEATISVFALGALMRAYTLPGKAGDSARAAFEQVQGSLLAGAAFGGALLVAHVVLTLVATTIDPIGRRDD